MQHELGTEGGQRQQVVSICCCRRPCFCDGSQMAPTHQAGRTAKLHSKASNLRLNSRVLTRDAGRKLGICTVKLADLQQFLLKMFICFCVYCKLILLNFFFLVAVPGRPCKVFMRAVSVAVYETKSWPATLTRVWQKSNLWLSLACAKAQTTISTECSALALS